MSIQTTGPKSYDFQYLVSVSLTLKLLAENQTNLKVFIEKIGGEDIEISYEKEDKIQTVEIQIKHNKGDIGINDLRDCLCHFQPRSFDNNVLHRLQHDKNRSYLLIEHARCNDSTKPFLSSYGSVMQRVKTEIDITKLLTAISKFEHNSKIKLSVKRNQFCVQLSQQAQFRQDIKELTNRVFIWEQTTEQVVIDNIHRLLSHHFHVRSSQIDTLINNLMGIVRIQGRDKHENIAPYFKKEIERYKILRPSVSSSFVKSDLVSTLEQNIKQNDILFLTGISMCGKTEIAKYLLNSFIDRGYNHLHTSDIEESMRFLRENIQEDRICLLDDPLGHFYEDVKSSMLLKRVTEVIRHIPQGRKLIITTRKEILDSLNQNTSQWIDATVNDSVFLNKVWTEIRNTSKFPETIARIIEQIINDNKLPVLQPGQLIYITNNYGQIESPTKEKLYHLGMVDSDVVAQQIKTKGIIFQEVYWVLGLTATTIVSIGLKELKYIFSANEYYPGILTKQPFRFRSSDIQRADIIKHLPNYEQHKDLSVNYQEALDYFEERGYISFKNDQYIFKHPLYFEASRILCRNLPRTKFNSFINYLKRSIALLTPQNASGAIKFSEFIYDYYLSDSYNEFKRLIESTIDTSLMSVYPSVQDAGLIFFVKKLDKIEDNLREKISEHLSNLSGIVSYIKWHEGKPYYLGTHSFSAAALSRLHKMSNKTKFTTTFNDLKSKANKPTPEEAFALLRYLEVTKTTPTNWPIGAFEKLINYDESFIREHAAYYLMSAYTGQYESLLDIIFMDDHPNVVFMAIKGSFNGWHRYPDNIKTLVLDRINKAFERDDVVLHSTHFMTQFGIGYSSASFDWREDVPDEEKPAMWLLWAKLLPVFFDKFPHFIQFNTGRFSATINESISKVKDIDLKVKITHSWISWVERFYLHETIIEHCMYSVVNFFGSHIKLISHDVRFNLLNRLMKVNSYLFKAYTIRWSIENWQSLTKVEKDFITNEIKKDKSGISTAVSITASQIPKEVLMLMFNDEELLTRPAKQIEEKIGKKLMRMCIGVSFVDDNYANALNGASETWERILSEYTLDASSDIYKVATRELFLSFAHNYANKNINDLRKTILNSHENEEVNKWIIDLYMEYMPNIYGKDLEILWDCLYAKANAKKRELILKLMENNIEYLDYREGLFVLGQDFDNIIFPKLNDDSFILNLLHAEKSLSNEERLDLLATNVKIIKTVLWKQGIRLYTTYRWLNGWIEKLNINDDELNALICDVYERIIKKERLQNEYFRKKIRDGLKKFYINRY